MDESNLLEMLSNIIIFKINRFYSLYITLPYPLHELHPYDDITITLHHKNGQKYWLCIKDAESAVDNLHYLLHKKRKIDHRIKGNLGFLWNEILQNRLEEKPYFMYANVKQWMGLKYHLWGAPGTVDPLEQTDTWLYRRNKKLIFMVTPSYGWHFSTRRHRKKLIPYETFIKNFKPILKITLDDSIVQELREWAAEFIQGLERVRQQDITESRRERNSDA